MKEVERVDEKTGMRYIDVTPTPAQHHRIMARLVDGQSPNNYVSNELRRIANIYEKVGLTWEYFNEVLNKMAKEKT